LGGERGGRPYAESWEFMEESLPKALAGETGRKGVRGRREEVRRKLRRDLSASALRVVDECAAFREVVTTKLEAGRTSRRSSRRTANGSAIALNIARNTGKCDMYG